MGIANYSPDRRGFRDPLCNKDTTGLDSPRFQPPPGSEALPAPPTFALGASGPWACDRKQIKTVTAYIMSACIDFVRLALLGIGHFSPKRGRAPDSPQTSDAKGPNISRQPAIPDG
ncbi:MAG: hypothetical protein KME26_05235 [Oscillatoria princeps RMCB-10]|nr:hypothetical protein [Oscillatoria princeps RMCB-10]